MAIKMPLVGGSCPLTGAKLQGAYPSGTMLRFISSVFSSAFSGGSVIIVGLPIIFSYSWYLFHQCKNLSFDGF